MGLFDTITCRYALPDPRHQDLSFQTKDLDCFLEEYTITIDGRLIRHARDGMFSRGPCRDVEWPVHGDLRMYESIEEGDGRRTWVEYVVRFTHGRVEWIRPAPDRQLGSGADDSDAVSPAPEEPRVRVGVDAPDPCAEPAPEARRLTAEEFVLHVPEKLELVDGHVPGEEPLLLLLLKSVGLRRAAELVGEDRWVRALGDDEP